MRLLNQYLCDHGAPVTAQLHVCQGLAGALNTLSVPRDGPYASNQTLGLGPPAPVLAGERVAPD